jgi:acyl-CoA hydrolase
MILTIHNTSKVVEVNGVPARIWEGQTDTGIKVHCYVTRVAVHQDEDCSQFERELAEQRAPSAVVEAIPLRLIL